MNAAAGVGDGVSVTADSLIALRHGARRHLAEPGGTSALPGGFAISRRGNGQIIADSRLYMPGDELRHVDRGATARTGELHIRTYHEERDRLRFLIADFRPCMLWGMRRALRSVAAAEALAWLGWQTVDSGGRVGLLAITAGERVHVPSRGRVRGMLAVIGGLVRAHRIAIDAAPRGLADPPLDNSLTGLDKLVPRGSEVLLASALDTPGADLDSVLGELSRHRNLRCLLVGDAGLDRLPAGSYPVVRADGTMMPLRYGGAAEAGTPQIEVLNDWPVAFLDAGSVMPEALRGTAA